MRGRISGWLKRLGLVAGVGAGAVYSYQSGTGLAVRAWLGQSSGTALHALALHEQGRTGEAIVAIKPLVVAAHPRLLDLVCDLVNGMEPVAPTKEGCVKAMQQHPTQGLVSLTDLAILAQDWDVAVSLIDERLAAGDTTAHFDRARMIQSAPPDRFGQDMLLDAIEASSAAQDPRGQYAAVVKSLNGKSGGVLSPVLEGLLAATPKMTAADAYFELAKLMQTGAVSSDLHYVEVLLRADAGGNPDAARYLAQYYTANASVDPGGKEARKWTAKAAASGDPVAQYNLALPLLGDPATAAEAIDLLDRSAAAGFIPALNLLGATLWQKPDLQAGPAEATKARALALIKQAAAQDDPNALFNLGNIYLAEGKRDEALSALRRASVLNSAPARELLLQLDAAD